MAAVGAAALTAAAVVVGTTEAEETVATTEVVGAAVDIKAVVDTKAAVLEAGDIVVAGLLLLGPRAETPIVPLARTRTGRPVTRVPARALRPANRPSSIARPPSRTVSGMASGEALAAGRLHRSEGKLQMAAPHRLARANRPLPMGSGIRLEGIAQVARPPLEAGPAKATKFGPIKIAPHLPRQRRHAEVSSRQGIGLLIHPASTRTTSCSLDSERVRHLSAGSAMEQRASSIPGGAVGIGLAEAGETVFMALTGSVAGAGTMDWGGAGVGA
jgi:hypothetical protein